MRGERRRGQDRGGDDWRQLERGAEDVIVEERMLERRSGWGRGAE
jgi:hypothetical protein